MVTVAGEGVNDYILVRPASGNRLEVYTREGRTARRFFFDAGDVDGVMLMGGGGNDRINASRITLPVYMDGGGGNDRLYGGAAGSVLNGGPGRDYLYGGAGNDMLFGGTGRDYLFGKHGSDVLGGGATNDDEAVLMAALTDVDGWASSDPYADRVAALDAALADLTDDNDRDLLLGQAGQDLFIDGAADRMIGRRSNENVL